MSLHPANPTPAHHHVDSMLARKFGPEVTNYFSGSTLNRVGFLRDDHSFLSQALRHPSTHFLPCNGLQPLVHSGLPPAQGRLAFVPLADVEPIVGPDVFAKTAEEMVRDFDSAVYQPQMVFLGIDERVEQGLTYQSRNRYTGAPFFAVDVTPRRGVKEACEQAAKKWQSDGMEFAKGRVMDVVHTDGALTRQPPIMVRYTDQRHQPQSTPKLGSFLTGTPGILSVLAADTPLCR